MPIINSSYRAPYYLPGGLLQTVIAGRWPRPSLSMDRETLELKDGDFVDLDWMTRNQKELIIVTHGLEGSSQSQYIIDLCNHPDALKFDILAWNCRSCSGRMNRLQKLYHHGEIEDIAEVIQHVVDTRKYEKIHLSGFSMGGNISIKFLAKNFDQAKHISSCAVVSAPCDLAASSRAMDRPQNILLKKYFKKNVGAKLAAKEAQFPGSFPMEQYEKIKNWNEIDRLFVAPFVGYETVEEFYTDVSAITFIDQVTTPLFLLNAKNDPVLAPSCHPVDKAQHSKIFYLELPRTGGHVYFPMKNENFAVKRILTFISQH